MTNLLEETISDLKLEGKQISDIIWIGSYDGSLIVPLSEFESVFNIEYDDGFGAQEIASDLVIVGKDWWMERHEYDGAESWRFKKIPVMEDAPEITTRVKGGMWDSLEEISKGS